MKKRTIISVLAASFSLSACLLINTFVSESSNVNVPQEILKYAIKKFKINSKNINDFKLVKKSLDLRILWRGCLIV